jgi:mRNA interferase RelE/StbE
MPDHYAVQFKPSAARDLRGLTKGVQRRIVRKLEALAVPPRPNGVKKLDGENSTYRVRVGDYRIIYQIQDAILVVLVIHIGHRRDVYR